MVAEHRVHFAGAIFHFLNRAFSLSAGKPNSPMTPVRQGLRRPCVSASWWVWTLVLLFLVLEASQAQWVGVDPTFPADSGPDNFVRVLAVQADGAVLLGGSFSNVNGGNRPFFARLKADGTVDTAFAAQVNGEVRGIQPLVSGQILISGTFSNVNGVFLPGLARLEADGGLDSGFVPPAPGPALSIANGVSAPDDTVWISGAFTDLSSRPLNHLARLLPNGSVDPAFHSPFAASDSVSFLAIQPDGRAICSGPFTNLAGMAVTNLARVNPDGSLDPTFQSGLGPGERVVRGVLDTEGRLVAAVSRMADYGMAISPPRLVRFNTNGSLDADYSISFESPGFPWNATVSSLALQPDGRILLSGTFLRVNGLARGKVARLMPDGSMDYCFDVAFGGEWTPLALAAGLDGRVIVGGSFLGLQGQAHPYLLRLVPPPGCAPGVIELTVPTLLTRKDALSVLVPVSRRGGADLEQTVAFETLDGSAHGGVDYVPTSGTLRFARGERSQFISIPLLYGSNAEGTNSFELRLTAPGNGSTLGEQTNVVITLTNPRPGTAGAPDTNYVVQLDGPVQSILPLDNGRVFITGSFTNVGGQFCPNLARLQADGSPDPNFVRAQPLEGYVWSVTLDTLGRILAAGEFQWVDGVWRPGLARFGTGGTLDASFAPFDAWPTNAYGGVVMQSVAVLADGSIVCGGTIPSGTYDTLDVLLKLSPNGDLDTAFTNHVPWGVVARRLGPLPNGGFLVQGIGFGSSLVSLHADGTLNFDFIPPADRQFTYYAGDFGLMPDGRVTVAGMPSAFLGLVSVGSLWRLAPDGSLDAGFSIAGSTNSWGNLDWVDAFCAGADGRVLVAGNFSTTNSYGFALRRFHADGSADFSFDQGSGFKASVSGSVSVNALARLPAGGWLAGGDFGAYDGFNQPYLVKLQPERISRPLTFSFAVTNVTIVETNAALTFEVRRSGDASGSASVTVRTRDGSATAGQDYQPLDSTLVFGPGEWTKTVTVNVLDDLLVEGTEQFTLSLTNATDGFGVAAPGTITISIQNNDAAVEFIANSFQAVEEEGFVLAAVTWSGALSTNSRALVTIVPIVGRSEDLGVSSVSIQYNVFPASRTNWFRIPIVDDAQHEPTRQFRLELTGGQNVLPGPLAAATLFLDDRDYQTTPARGVAGVVEAMASSPDGGVYLVGDFTGVHGQPRVRVARLQPDGEVDPRFDPGEGPNANVSAVAVQADGKVVIAGSFTAVKTIPRAGLARLNTDGSPDPTFNPGFGVQSTNGTAFIRVLLPQSDGSLFIGGAFTHFDNQYSRLLARLLPDGSADRAFVSPLHDNPGPWTRVENNCAVYALAPQPEGKILAAGSLYSGGWIYPGIDPSLATVVRFGQNGILDQAFSKATNSARCLALTGNGKILVGGNSGTTWLPITRLGTNGAQDPTFRVQNAPTNSFYNSEIRQLLVQPDGRILFCAAIYNPILTNPPTLGTAYLDRAVIGRLLPDGTWDSSFNLVTCPLPLVRQPGPFWFNDPMARPTQSLQPTVPAVSIVRQPNGVLVLGGVFDAINGEPRHRLARLDPDGSIRGRLILLLAKAEPLRLVLPPEVETPYVIQSSPDLVHWVDWLANDYPWWSAELWFPTSEPARFFRTRFAP